MKERGKKINQYAAVIFFFWVTLVIPLFFENAYFNMLEAKGHVYTVGAGIVLMLMIAGGVMQKSVRYLLPERNSLLDWSICLLGIVALISGVCSSNKWASFWGTEGWRVGAFALFTFSLLYKLLSEYLNYRQNLWLPVMEVNLLIFVIGIFHSMGVDILGLHEYIEPTQYYWYISTIGNINWYVGYLCLIVPMMAVFYMSAKSVFSRNVCFVFLIFACINMVLCASDGLYLGIGVCSFFAIPYVVSEETRIQRFFSLVLIYGCSLVFVRFCPLFREKVSDIQGISGFFLRPECAAVITVAGIIGMLVVRNRWRRLSRRQIKAVVLVLELLLIIVAGIFLWDTIMNFDESWGTNRGRTWMYSMELFQGYSIKEKILGVGPEMLRSCYAELSTHFSRKILVAHSEPLQILLTMGLAGLLCWLGMWGSMVISYFKKHLWQTEAVAFALPLMAYLGQTFVNSQQAMNMALLCVVLACYRIHFSKREFLPEGMK